MSGRKTRARKIAVSAITVLPISGAMVGATGGLAQAAIGNASVGSQVTSAAVGNALVFSVTQAIGNAFVANESAAIGNAFTAVDLSVRLGGSSPS